MELHNAWNCDTSYSDSYTTNRVEFEEFAVEDGIGFEMSHCTLNNTQLHITKQLLHINRRHKPIYDSQKKGKY